MCHNLKIDAWRAPARALANNTQKRMGAFSAPVMEHGMPLFCAQRE
jgi:hypothetical protein